MSSNDEVKRFFSSQQFAVAGASQDKAKFGYKILQWYVTRGLPVTPINPKSSSITVGTVGKSSPLATVASVSELPNPETTGLSIVTPPKATKQILEDAKRLGIKAVFLQPGTYDQEILDYARKEFEAGIGGTDGGAGFEGWCVLVDGDNGLKQASRL